MDTDRFDAIARFIGSRTTRRMAVGLAAMGLLSSAVPDATAARCSATRPCPACKRCKRHRCRPDAMQDGAPCTGGTCQDGTCVCTDPNTHRCPGTGVCGECCGAGECPAGEFCQSVQGGPFLCYCDLITSVECQQVCIPKSCATSCAKSCTGPSADCGCGGALTCQDEAQGQFRCAGLKHRLPALPGSCSSTR